MATPSLRKLRPLVKPIRSELLTGRFKFTKRAELFIRSHDETLSVAMRVNFALV
jgi:hypothetical protein